MTLAQDLLISPIELQNLTQLSPNYLVSSSTLSDSKKRAKFINQQLDRIYLDNRNSSIIFSTLIFMLHFGWFVTFAASISNKAIEWALLYLHSTISSLIFATFFFAIFNLFLLLFSYRNLKAIERDRQFQTLRDLIDEIERYNLIAGNFIININAISSLSEAGAKVGLDNRQQVIKNISKLKNDLLKALKIERIFRENPQIDPQSLNFDFTSLSALELNNRAVEYANEVNQLVEIGISVQTEMDSLFNKKY